jgi:hypothetical protein
VLGFLMTVQALLIVVMQSVIEWQKWKLRKARTSNNLVSVNITEDNQGEFDDTRNFVLVLISICGLILISRYPIYVFKNYLYQLKKMQSTEHVFSKLKIYITFMKYRI